MSDKINITFSMAEFNKAINGLEKESKKILDQVDDEIGAGLEEIALKAKSYAPIDIEGTPISQSISVQKNRPLSYTLWAKNPYSAYYEFGTGNYAKSYVPSLPSEWQKIAKEYYINGKGTIPRTSFFYPSITEGIPKIIKRINTIFKK
jgi:hypothetical protein